MNKRLNWILVTGAANDLNHEEVEVAKQVGTMLAREGYGLIVGDWHGVDWSVKTAFLEALPAQKHSTHVSST